MTKNDHFFAKNDQILPRQIEKIAFFYRCFCHFLNQKNDHEQQEMTHFGDKKRTSFR